MNKNEFKAIMKIAKKMNWKSVNFKDILTMVRNQQALELDCYGDCDDTEETLLSMAMWDKEKVISCLHVDSYTSLHNWIWFCDEMGIDAMNAHTLLSTYDQVKEALAEEHDAEYEEWLEDYYSDYDAEIMRDVMWMNHHC